MTIEKNRIEHIFAQKGSLADHKKLDDYLSDEKSNKELREVIRDQWQIFEPEPEPYFNPDHNFYKLFNAIRHLKDEKSRLLYRVSQVAAVLLAGLFIAGAIYFKGEKPAAIQKQFVEFYSHTGYRNKFTLPDGTSGWLSHNSELKYYLDSNSARIVELDGMAYFDVVHLDKNRPFKVKTPSNLDIEVLGTRFNVASYSNENTCEVVLEQGSVRLSMQDKQVGKLVPNERVVYNVAENNLSKSVVNVGDYIEWKDGKLIMNDLSLAESCQKLSRFYNADIVLGSDDLKNRKVRLMLEDESLDEALELLAHLFPVKYEVTERKQTTDNSFSKKKIILKLK